MQNRIQSEGCQFHVPEDLYYTKDMAKDPMLEMLQWVMGKFMEIEVARKTGAEKGIHAESRTGYRCGYRIRRFDTRLGTIYLSVQKAPGPRT